MANKPRLKGSLLSSEKMFCRHTKSPLYRRIFVLIEMSMRESLCGKKTMADEKDCEGASSLENSRSRVGGVDSRYLATLQPQDRKRFQEKLKYVVDGELLEIQNPYESWNAPSWSDKPTKLVHR